MPRPNFFVLNCVAAAACWCNLPLSAAWCQATNPPAPNQQPAVPELPAIPDEPRTVDPGRFVHPSLARTVSVQFPNSSVRDILAWLTDNAGLPVVVDQRALDAAGVLMGDPYSESLDNQPIYFMLNRLSMLGLDWYVEDDVVHITDQETGRGHMTTRSYVIGDLLDQKYEADALVSAVTSIVDPESYVSAGGEADVQVLGDVLFVRQTDHNHRLLGCLLAGVRGPARQTLIGRPASDVAIREQLQQPVDVNADEAPLESVVQSLSQRSGIDIRLETAALRDAGLRVRQPVTLQLTSRSMRTILNLLAQNLDLAWMLRDGVVWLTTPERAEEAAEIALYDVRDLCRNAEESDALSRAITSQADPASWVEVGGQGDLLFLRPGLMAMVHTEKAHQEVLGLLEAYRTALRNSKPRGQAEDPKQAVTTQYYRMDKGVAESLLQHLPELVAADSWRTADRPEGVGTILMLASSPEAVEGELLERAVLLIRQTGLAHQEITTIISRVENGDPRFGKDPFGSDSMGGMGGMGGFGGGFFRVRFGD